HSTSDSNSSRVSCNRTARAYTRNIDRYPLFRPGWAKLSSIRSYTMSLLRGLLASQRNAGKPGIYTSRANSWKGLNLEVNQDKDPVRGYVQRLGFPEMLGRSLDEAERLYHSKDNEFSLKASMGHLRSFLENLQKLILPAMHAKFGGNLPQTWGEGLSY